MRIAPFLFLALLAAAAPAPAGEPAPRKLTRQELSGAIFADPTTVLKQETGEGGPYPTRDLEAFRSPDGRFDAGVYESGATRIAISEPYGVDEFMYFLEGGVTLTSPGGDALVVEAGEAVIIPREWRGVWETRGYRKIYVIYSPDRPID